MTAFINPGYFIDINGVYSGLILGSFWARFGPPGVILLDTEKLSLACDFDILRALEGAETFQK